MYFLTIIITKLTRNLLDLHFISAGCVDNGDIYLDCNSDQFSNLWKHQNYLVTVSIRHT